MIDTDKYEGHTEGPWTLSEEYAYKLFVYAGDVRLAKMDYSSRRRFNEHGNPEDVNAQLIADAPLLLAEVKRLRNKNINYIKLIDDITLWIAKSPYESDYIIAYVDEKMSEIHLGVEEE